MNHKVYLLDGFYTTDRSLKVCYVDVSGYNVEGCKWIGLNRFTETLHACH